VERSALLKQLLKDGNNQIVEQDITGNYHFNGNFNNVNSLKAALSKLPAERYESLVEMDTPILLGVFEEVFNHKAFTGRSGTFFGYEGLGSIYWHMVSKLLLAVQENCLVAIQNKESDELIGKLLEHYYEINEGIGVHKSPELYGAFPTDPYSHTPAGKGAQQPGMTGQVKEDVLCRFGELGVFVAAGKLYFKPALLRKSELLKEPGIFKYPDVNRQEKEIMLEKNSLCFTYCQVPVVYQLADKNAIQVHYANQSTKTLETLIMDADLSKKIFERTGEITQITVSLSGSFL
jgi:hypothetical protein